MDEQQRVRAIRVAATRRASSVGADDEQRRRLGEDRAVTLGELRLRPGGKALVRLVHAARERAKAEQPPDDGEHEERDHGKDRPQPPAAPTLRRSGRVRVLRRGALRLPEWNLALLAAAAIQPVGLLSLGHCGALW